MEQKSEASQVLAVTAQYTKDLSFENINPVSQFHDVSTTQPQIDIQLKVDVSKNEKEADSYAVSLIVNIEAKMDKPMFILDLNYRGEFVIRGFPDDLLDSILYIECPRLLFPFARNIVAAAISEGGFPPLYMAPVNFAELYRQQQEANSQTLQ